jgi:hypothetical protein
LNRNAIPLSRKIYWPDLERAANPPRQLQKSLIKAGFFSLGRGLIKGLPWLAGGAATRAMAHLVGKISHPFGGGEPIQSQNLRGRGALKTSYAQATISSR